MNVEQWTHENIEGAESDTIECVWDGSVCTLILNDEQVDSTDVGEIPDSPELRLSHEINIVNYFYAYGT